MLLLEFSELVFLNVYAQNNGWTAESMAKRRAWDEELRRFLVPGDPSDQAGRCANGSAVGDPVTRPRAADGCSLKPLIWTGDLNACHREVDVSHPAFFANQKAEGKNGKTPVALPADPDDRGQPGFTVNERKRFDALVKDAGLVDAYRELHGDAEMRMTWFGHPGVTQVGKYRGKGMRLDYFFVDGGDFVRENVESCVQATDGIPVGRSWARSMPAAVPRAKRQSTWSVEPLSPASRCVVCFSSRGSERACSSPSVWSTSRRADDEAFSNITGTSSHWVSMTQHELARFHSMYPISSSVIIPLDCWLSATGLTPRIFPLEDPCGSPFA